MLLKQFLSAIFELYFLQTAVFAEHIFSVLLFHFCGSVLRKDIPEIFAKKTTLGRDVFVWQTKPLARLILFTSEHYYISSLRLELWVATKVIRVQLVS